MTFKYTSNTLKKIEQLFEEAGFRIRYEKGTFTSGYCLLEDKKIVVINKFLNLEGKINALLDILTKLELKKQDLNEDMLRFYQTCLQINSNKLPNIISPLDIDKQ